MTLEAWLLGAVTPDNFEAEEGRPSFLSFASLTNS